MAAGARYLRDCDRRPTLAGVYKVLEAIKADRKAALFEAGPSGYRDRFTGPLVHPDAMLWMRYWPKSVPPELQARHEKAWRDAGLEPYYPPADATFDHLAPPSRPA